MNRRFVIGLSNHRVLGPVFFPFILKQKTDKEFYEVQERITLKNLSKYEPELSNDQINLVKIIEEYSDNSLVKIFSKKKVSPQEFFAKIGNDMLVFQIRPYIERRLLSCIEILAGNEINIFHKQNQNNIYESERIDIVEETVESVFNFKRVNGELSYFLSIKHGDNEIKLTRKSGIILSNDPCRLVLNNRLFIFDDIDGKKLQPFFTKEFIQVPQRTENKFLETFVKNVIRTYKVNTDAFEIINKDSKPSPILSLENDLSERPVLLLKFRYDEETIYYANKKSDLKVTFKDEKNIRTFTRHNRNYDFENEVIVRLLEFGLKNIAGAYFFPLDIKKADNLFVLYKLINWLNYNAAELQSLGIDVAQNKNNVNYYLKKFELDIQISEGNNDWFDLNIVVKFSGFEIKFISFRNHILDEKREYELPDGTIVILPEEWFSRFKHIFKFGKANEDKISLEKQHFALIQESIKGLKEGYTKKLKKWFADKKETEYEIPDEVHAELRSYQVKGYSWMMQLYENMFGGCLADDMGLGKTLQTLTLLKKVIGEEKLRDYGPATSTLSQQLTIFDMTEQAKITKAMPSLIVVPTSLVFNWINEIKKFVPSVKTVFYGGSNRKPLKYYYENYDIILTSYGIIRNDVDVFKGFDFLYIILDESQVVKNPFSKTYKALMEFNSTHKLALTGTPIENSLTDLWAQMNFLNHGLLGSLEFFKNEFVTPIEKNKNSERSEKLKVLISPFILRRTKDEVAKDLPALSTQTIYCDMSEDQQKYYESEKSKVRNLIMQNIHEEGIEKSSILILQSLTRLRQIANHPVMVDKDYVLESGKYEEITRNLENIVAEGHKVLVFSSFVKHLALFSEFCDKNEIPYTLLTGETTNRQEKVKKFQEDTEIRIFLISLKAGGFGLNLTAADYVFMLDPWWNPATEQQALSRAHRIGQDKNVFVYRFIAKDTIEEKIIRLQEKKSNLAEAFINENNPFKGIEEKDILDLLD